ncbi:hypothetical protein L7F22_017739 [Adiantum nelumboides]|nr:hypothetical protein [Adiantum nelumboides]
MTTISQITAAWNINSSHTIRSSTVPAPACIRSNLKDRAASETGTRVFVGNIPMYASEEEVAEALSVFGPVVAFNLVVDRASGRPKGYGFCNFRDEETALSAQRNQKGAALCHGRQLRVGPVGARLKQQQQQQQKAGSASSNYETSCQAGYPARPQQQERELDVFALRQAKKLRLKLMSTSSRTIQIKPADATATTSSGAQNSGSSGLSYSRKRDYSSASASHASSASSSAGSTASCPDHVLIAANQDGAGLRPEKKAQRILSNQDQRGGDIRVVAESTSTYGSTCSSSHQVDESVKVDIDQLMGSEFAGMPNASCSTNSSPTSIISSEAGCDQPQLNVHVDIMVESSFGRLVTSDIVDNTRLGPDDCHYIAEYAKQGTPTDDDVLAEYRGTQLQQVNKIPTNLQPQLTTPTHGSDPNSIFQSGAAASADVDVEDNMVRDLQALLHLLQANITSSSKYIHVAKHGQISS